MPEVPANNDPAPVPPVRPEIEECCHSGCDPCIFDLYEEAMDRYRVQLRAWEARRTGMLVKKRKSSAKK